MAKPRGRGEGSISERPDGRWQGRVDLGRGPDGKRQRKTIYGATRKAVASELNMLLGRAESGELLNTSTPTVDSWLNDWFSTHADDWRPTTRRTYRAAIDLWLVPHLGPIRLEKLKPTTIQRWINEATAPLTVEQATLLLDVISNHRLGPMVLVSLTMGLRIGEVSGMTWPDFDLTARTLKVRQQVQAVGDGHLSIVPLKTANSQRTLTLPTLVVEALRAHRVRQLEERLRAGQAWHQDADLVFTMPNGPGGASEPRKRRPDGAPDGGRPPAYALPHPAPHGRDAPPDGRRASVRCEPDSWPPRDQHDGRHLRASGPGDDRRRRRADGCAAVEEESLRVSVRVYWPAKWQIFQGTRPPRVNSGLTAQPLRVRRAGRRGRGAVFDAPFGGDSRSTLVTAMGLPSSCSRTET